MRGADTALHSFGADNPPLSETADQGDRVAAQCDAAETPLVASQPPRPKLEAGQLAHQIGGWLLTSLLAPHGREVECRGPLHSIDAAIGWVLRGEHVFPDKPEPPGTSWLWASCAEREQSAARDLGLSIGTDFIASPLHCVVRPAGSGHQPSRLMIQPFATASIPIF